MFAGRTRIEVHASHVGLAAGDALCTETPLLIGTSRGLYLSQVFDVPSLSSSPPGRSPKIPSCHPGLALSDTPPSEANTLPSAPGLLGLGLGGTSPAVSPFLDLLAAAILARYPDCRMSSPLVCGSFSPGVVDLSPSSRSSLSPPRPSDAASPSAPPSSRFRSEEGAVLEALEQLAVCDSTDQNSGGTFSPGTDRRQFGRPMVQGIDRLHGALLPRFKERLSKNDLCSIFSLVRLAALPLPEGDEDSTQQDSLLAHSTSPALRDPRARSSAAEGSDSRAGTATSAGSRSTTSVARMGFFPLLLAFAGSPTCCPNTFLSFLGADSGPRAVYVLLKPLSYRSHESSPSPLSEELSSPCGPGHVEDGADHAWRQSAGSEPAPGAGPNSSGEGAGSAEVYRRAPRRLHISPATSLESLYLPTFMRQAAIKRRSLGMAASECSCPRCTQLPEFCRAFYCVSCRDQGSARMSGGLHKDKQEQSESWKTTPARAHLGHVHEEPRLRPSGPPAIEPDPPNGREAGSPASDTRKAREGFQVEGVTDERSADPVVCPSGPSKSLSLMDTPMHCQACGQEVRQAALFFRPPAG